MTDSNPAPRWSIPQMHSVLQCMATAGRAILDVYDSDQTVIATQKADRSPLTEADLASHRILAQGLADWGWLILSEEDTRNHAATTRSQADTLWLVDPLDGTKEFLRRSGEFAINVALVHQGEVIWGAVHAPVLQTTWFGGKHYGAWRMDADADPRQASAIRIAAPAQRPVRILASRDHRGDGEATVLARLDASEWGPATCIQQGSALKYSAIAQGNADFMLRLHPCMEWDVAAPQAILEAAGGAVFDLHGQPLRYNQSESLLVPSLVAIGDASLPWRLWMEPESA